MTESEEDSPNPNDGDTERLAIREKLSSMSFEELQKLKERMGAKVYKEAVFGKPTRTVEDKPPVFKRENKNRPREMSSKKPVSMIREVEGVSKLRKQVRDPRFDPLCGEFDKKVFKESYSFLDEVRANDIKSLKAELKECEDDERRRTIKLLLQRLTNQAREESKNKLKREKMKEEKERLLTELKQGKKPYASKSEKRVKDLVEQFEELKQKGKLRKHIERRRKKMSQKDKKGDRLPQT